MKLPSIKKMSQSVVAVLGVVVLLISLPAFGQATREMSLEQMEQNLAKIKRSIDETKLRIKTVKDARFLPEIYFALAEFYVSQARFMYSIKLTKNPDVPVDELDFTDTKRPKYKAIETYETLIDKFPKLAERDKALFFKAHEQRELGQLEPMINTHRQLTKEYPSSRYWTESQIIIGDYYFEEKKELELALIAFGNVLKKPSGPFTPIAHYKRGWCYINLAKFKKALLSFENVLSTSSGQDLSSLPEIYRKTDVRRDALMAMVWPYSEVKYKDLRRMGKNRHDTLSYFYELSPDRNSYEKVLYKLGRRLGLKHKYITSTKVYFELLRISTDIESRIDVVERLYVAMKNTGKAWPVHGFVHEVAKTISAIKTSPKLKKAQRKKSLHDFEIFARDVATRQHKRAKKTQSKEDWAKTVREYEDYLWAFPRAKKALSLRLNLAEAYFNSKKVLEAAKQYEILSKRLRSKKLKKEMMDSAIQSYITSLRTQSKLNRLALSEVRNGLRDVGLKYLRSYPKDKATADIRFNIAQTYYDERDFANAIKKMRDYIAKHPRGKKLSVAANLLLDAHNQKEDYKGLVKEGERIIANKRIKDATLKSQVKQIVQQAEMKQVQEKSGEFGSKSYANNLLKLARKYKGSSLGDRALYEAFVSFKTRKDPKAYDSGEQLLMQHGTSKYAKEVVSQMGQMALVSADFRRAALYFELYQEKYPRQGDAVELLKSAAVMREQMGDLKIAVNDYKRVNDYTSVARMDYLAQDWSALGRSAPRAGGMYSSYWEGLAQYRLRGLGGARSALTMTSQSGPTDDKEKEMAAHSLYLLSMGAMERYKKIQIRAGQEAKAVSDKAALLKDLEAQLNKVIAFGNGRWAVAGLYGLGQANREFATFISNAPMPKGLSGGQRKQYKAALAQQAASYGKAAKSYFSKCVNTAEKFDVFTGFVKGCLSSGRVQVSEEKETRVLARSREKDPPGSARIRRKLLDNPRNTGLLKNLATLYIKSKDYPMAEVTLTRALEIAPSNAGLMAKVGEVKLFRNELQEARAWFKKALTKNSSEPLAVHGMYGLYKKFGFKRKAKQYRSKASRVGPPRGAMHPIIRGA